MIHKQKIHKHMITRDQVDMGKMYIKQRSVLGIGKGPNKSFVCWEMKMA